MNTSLILFEEFLENLNETATANAKESPIAGLDAQCFFSLHCHEKGQKSNTPWSHLVFVTTITTAGCVKVLSQV